MSECERETCKFWTEDAGCFWLACESSEAAARSTADGGQLATDGEG
jgi:hypothetical protein